MELGWALMLHSGGRSFPMFRNSSSHRSHTAFHTAHHLESQTLDVSIMLTSLG
jgi:hypothetical protein